MATYLELRGLFNDGDLINKVTVATGVYANSLLSGPPTTKENKWIAQVLKDPQAEGRKILVGVLVANAGLTVAQIKAASDPDIQTKVDAIAPILVDALSGV